MKLNHIVLSQLKGLKEGQKVDFMAVIVDATCCEKINENRKWVKLRLTDGSLIDESPLTIHVFGFASNQLPRVSTIGDIIYFR